MADSSAVTLGKGLYGHYSCLLRQNSSKLVGLYLGNDLEMAGSLVVTWQEETLCGDCSGLPGQSSLSQ